MRSRGAPVGLLLVFALPALRCGDPLVDERYRGDPLFVVQGRVESFTAPEGIRFEDYDVLASLFWITDLNTQNAFVEQLSVSTQVSFPATFELKVFELPRREHHLRLTDGTELAFGTLLVYVDVDRSGQYSEGDRVIGGSGRTGLVYADVEIPLSTQLIDVFVPAGFSVRRLEYLCGQLPEDQGLVLEYEFSGRPCDLDLSCPQDQRCLPMRRVCVATEDPGVTRCSAEVRCQSDRQVCHPEERICIPREPLADQLCRTSDGCEAEEECLAYYGCASPMRPEPVSSCRADLDCEPLGFVCDPNYRICVPADALEINVPGTFEPALLTCSPTRG